MSRAKDLIVEDERKRQAAIQVAVMAGELKECDLCERRFEEHSEDSLKKAYAIGNSLITKNDPRIRPFKNTSQDRKELADILQDLWTNFSDKCKCREQARED